MSPIKLGGAQINNIRLGATKINKAYLGSTLVYSSEFIGTVTIVTAITYAGETIVDTGCIPNGATIAMVAQISGTATDATFAWTRPAGSSAPVAGLTTGTLTWTAVAGDGGTYGVTVTSRNSSDSPKSTLETINIFGYTPPAFTDADANQWIIRVELRDCGALEAGVRTAMNQLVVDLKSSGFYGNSAVIHPLIGARNSRSLVPIKSPAYNINPASYDRQKGVRQDVSANIAGTWDYDFASRINAGSAGTAVYITSFASSGLQNGPSAAIVCFGHQLGNTKDLGALNYFGYRVGGRGVDLPVPGNDPPIPPGGGPLFAAASYTGSLESTTTKGRFNDNVASVVSSTSAPGTTKLALVPPNVSGYLYPGFRVDWAFVISGGGSSDYTSTALRTIIETYVTAVQAAIPG
jgi:hypothetical protein